MKQQNRWGLVQASLDGESFDSLVEHAALFLNNPLVIIDTAYRITAYSHCITAPDTVWSNAVTRGYVTLEFAATLNNWDALKDSNTRFECMTVGQITPLRRRFYKMEFQGRLLGYLNITEGNAALEQIAEEDYHLVAQILAKEMYAQLKFRDNRRRSNNEDILLQLVNGGFINRGHFLDCLQLSELDPSGPYRVLCCDLVDFLSYNAGEDEFKHQLLQFFPYGTIVIVERILIILVPARYCHPDDTSLLSRLNKYLKSKDLHFGISDYFSDLFSLPHYHKQALEACRLHRYLLDHTLRYTFFDQVKTYAILSCIPKEKRLYYCNQQVYAMYQYDKAQNTEYLNTLLIYLQTSHSIKSTAARLLLHRNTINYRIGRIRDLFHLEFDSPSSANQVLLSCQLLQLTEETR